jgi:hypothetical protein
VNIDAATCNLERLNKRIFKIGVELRGFWTFQLEASPSISILRHFPSLSSASKQFHAF